VRLQRLDRRLDVVVLEIALEVEVEEVLERRIADRSRLQLGEVQVVVGEYVQTRR